MGKILLLINNIAIQVKKSEEVVELIKLVRENLDGALEDIANGKIVFYPTKIPKKSINQAGIAENTLTDIERQKYLQNTAVINWQEPAIIECSEIIVSNCKTEREYIRKAFEYVRDEILHSRDYRTEIVTCTASEVFHNKTGYCYAKSHLLAALLRAQNIPTGFCYQRLSLEENGPPYSLHGINAVYLEDVGWYRIDARGNKEGVNARFTPPIENLAFLVTEKSEKDFPEIWSDPLPIVVEALQSYKSVEEFYKNLPDIQVLQLKNG
jgi:transglutaminase-like putative cysteine protease